MRLRLYSSMAVPALALGACLSSPAEVSALDVPPARLDLTLTTPIGRKIPMRAFLPPVDCSPCTLIIFSHGAYAAFDRYDALLTDWADRGYVIVAPQHVDSEEHPDRDAWTMDESRPARLEDYAIISGTFAKASYSLGGLTFSGRQIAAGHSYGGLIAQVAGGARLANPALEMPQNARAPEAIIALSPPSELDGLITLDGFARIDTPMLLVTGTHDILPGFIDEWHGHLDGYEAAPAELSYALVYEGMDHYFNGAFGRETEDGAGAAEAIDDLNARIAAFIEDALGDTLPTGLDWRAQATDLVETWTRQGDLS